jgi:glycosyltransferase involved in cell wall biosynthesis
VPKILLIEPVLAHYQKDVFKILTENEEFDFDIIAGSSYQGINSLQGEYSLFSHSTFKILSHTFYYLRGAVKYALSEKTDAIICTGVDFHLLHTILLFIIYRIVFRKRFYWWSHASSGHQGKFGFFIRKLFYKTSSGIFAYNMAGKINLNLMGIADQKIMVVNNSLNQEDYGYLNHNLYDKKKGNPFTILYSGRVTKAKKVDILIMALGLLSKRNVFKFKCYIVGDGNLEELIKIANELNISDKVEFIGAKYGKNVHPYFLNSDLFVYPGGIGLSAVHSLSFGLPILTTDNLPLHFPEFELIKPGFNGDLFIDNSFEDLANKIVEWKNKLDIKRDIYINNCVQQIKDMGYLPEIVSSKVLDFMKSEL